MIAMLLLMAEPVQQGAQTSAVATARIVGGARISLAGEKVETAQAEPQRRRTVRHEDGRVQPLQLIEFQ